MGQIWDTLIIQPFSWLLLTLYQFTGNYGLALILFALIAKVVLLYVSLRGKIGTMRQQRLAPKMKEIERQTKGDKQKYQEAVSKMYQQEGVSPTGGCLWMAIPFPIIIALFSVIREPLKNLMKLTSDQIMTVYNHFYPAEAIESIGQAGYYVQVDLAQKIHENFDQVKALLPEAQGLIDMNFNFLGLNLAEIPQWPWPLSNASWVLIVPLLSGATAYLSSWATQKFSGSNQQMQGSMRIMFMLMPLMSVYFSFITPAALGVYWTTQNLLGIVQEYFLTKQARKVLDKEDAAKAEAAARRKAAEEKFKEEARQKKLAEIEEKKKLGKYKKTYRVTNNPSNRSGKKKKEEPGEDVNES